MDAQLEAEMEETVQEALEEERSEEEMEALLQEEEEEEDDEEEEEEEEEDDEELQCLLHALQATDESDHEIWYDLGARGVCYGFDNGLDNGLDSGHASVAHLAFDRRPACWLGITLIARMCLRTLLAAHDLGDTEEALEFYERAVALNPVDPLLLSNMGVALLELGRSTDAFHCYRRALKADPHSVNARFNAGELLLEMGKLGGLKALLADTPKDAMCDEGLQSLEAELAAAVGQQ